MGGGRKGNILGRVTDSQILEHEHIWHVGKREQYPHIMLSIPDPS